MKLIYFFYFFLIRGIKQSENLRSFFLRKGKFILYIKQLKLSLSTVYHSLDFLQIHQYISPFNFITLQGKNCKKLVLISSKQSSLRIRLYSREVTLEGCFKSFTELMYVISNFTTYSYVYSSAVCNNMGVINNVESGPLNG